jgi:hypothetical protein
MVTRAKKNKPAHEPGPDEMTLDEGWELLNARAQMYLGISGMEFLNRWDAGDYDDDPDRPEVMNVAAVIAGVR